jgi:hypothetical protein
MNKEEKKQWLESKGWVERDKTVRDSGMYNVLFAAFVAGRLSTVLPETSPPERIEALFKNWLRSAAE